MPALPRILRASTALLAAAALAVSSAASTPAQTLGPDGKPVTNDAGVTFGVAAHRGGMDQWPENSVEAYTHSVAAGFDMIEADIVFTSDGYGVMNHFDTLHDRCTDAGRAIHTMTLEEVQQVRCEDLNGDKVVPIPTFEDLADVLAGQTDTGLMLDLKTYTGQSTASRQTWARSAVQLVKSHGLLDQTEFITFYWASMLPAIRDEAPDSYVLALEHGGLNLDRVRLAASLGADGYGVPMEKTSAFLASYVKSLGMDSTPWQVFDEEQRAFTISYGGKHQLFISNSPSTTQARLLDGTIDINPVRKPTTTTLDAPVTISKATYKAKVKKYPKVGTSIVPADAIPMLRDVTLTVKVTGGKGKGHLYVGAYSAPTSTGTTVRLPDGTKTLTLRAPLGDGRKLRIYTTRTVELRVKVTAYARIRFN